MTIGPLALTDGAVMYFAIVLGACLLGPFALIGLLHVADFGCRLISKLRRTAPAALSKGSDT